MSQENQSNESPTLWLFNSLLWNMAHLQMIFPARKLHLFWIFQFAMS